MALRAYYSLCVRNYTCQAQVPNEMLGIEPGSGRVLRSIGHAPVSFYFTLICLSLLSLFSFFASVSLSWGLHLISLCMLE